ncbi:diacylglycerol kinase [Vibrio cholerae]|uniref:diacylglycerol kinase n=1 Tax=Vibrio cholerae TaxID=666 RepID=UPI00115B3F8D|nr:diacylglycerol kinase [Vibrio cholerae]EGR3964646.1 diacylglycerol kinase [Vibrio cholerae]MBD1190778.1 diacylglycerol kinase [Vibrio cholerae]MCD1212575.1 diacylglycerol kinase [Vibrio cholerae]TQP10240.1 diacylglycerol kinase [Vibrio cholerae]TQP20279.1 diacylglycerol kinase [Vibrio cholerae]
MKHSRTGFSRIIYATGYSMKGFAAAWKNEAAFRQEVTLALPLITLSFFLPVSTIEQVLMVGSLVLILIAELLNSAIEAVVDRIGAERHELSGRAKDIGSAAVFVALCFAAFTWGIILFNTYTQTT